MTIIIETERLYLRLWETGDVQPYWAIRVMEKIGLQRDLKGDFRHPKLALDHPLSQHVLYRLRKDHYQR